MWRALLFNDTAIQGHHGCHLVNLRIMELASSNNIALTWRGSNLQQMISLDPSQYDVLLINGEGSLHHNSKMARQIATAIEWANQSELPVVLLNSIYQQNEAAIDDALRKADLIFVRDRRSQAALAKLDIQSQYAPDLSLSWHVEKRERQNGRICLTDSTLRSVDRQMFDLAEQDDAFDYLPLKARPSSGQNGTMGNASRRVKYRFKKHVLAPIRGGFYGARYQNAVSEFSDFASKYAQYSFVLAARFHAICMAIDLGIPFCGLSSNSWKVEALLDEAGLTSRQIAPEELSAQKILELQATHGSWSNSEMASMEALRQTALSTSQDMFSQITGLPNRA